MRAIKLFAICMFIFNFLLLLSCETEEEQEMVFEEEMEDVVPCAHIIEMPENGPLASSYALMPYQGDTSSASGSAAYTIKFKKENSEDSWRFKTSETGVEHFGGYSCFADCPSNEGQEVLIRYNNAYKSKSIQFLTQVINSAAVERPFGMVNFKVTSIQNCSLSGPNKIADVLDILVYTGSWLTSFSLSSTFSIVLNERSFPEASEEENLEIIDNFELGDQAFNSVYLLEDEEIGLVIYYHIEAGILKVVDSNNEVLLREGL